MGDCTCVNCVKVRGSLPHHGPGCACSACNIHRNHMNLTPGCACSTCVAIRKEHAAPCTADRHTECDICHGMKLCRGIRKGGALHERWHDPLLHSSPQCPACYELAHPTDGIDVNALLSSKQLLANELAAANGERYRLTERIRNLETQAQAWKLRQDLLDAKEERLQQTIATRSRYINLGDA
ncbi:hypothetical protein LCGC14_2462090 [marine sediment metagenome]|uniref:Uncharacterized protein n=1 Tax=marine sediment metagenome TaxID=412755 RepID=A0A0F9BDM4_9ZZZZ